MNQWMREFMSRWTNEPKNQWFSESVRQSMNRWFNESPNEWIIEPRNQWISESVNRRWMGRWYSESVIHWFTDSMNGWTNESINQRMNESMKHWINEALKQWTDESVHQWIKEPMNQWIDESMHFSDFIFQKCSDPFLFLRFWHQSIFFEMQIELWLQYRAHFANLPRALRSLPFFNSLKCKSRLVRILPTSSSKSARSMSIFQHSSRTRENRDPTSATLGATLRQKRKVSRPWAVSPLDSHASELLHFQTTWSWVVDMMMLMHGDGVDIWWEC